jgi:hypothetical protein
MLLVGQAGLLTGAALATRTDVATDAVLLASAAVSLLVAWRDERDRSARRRIRRYEVDGGDGSGSLAA